MANKSAGEEKCEWKGLIVFPALRRSQTKHSVPFALGNLWKFTSKFSVEKKAPTVYRNFRVFLTRNFRSIRFPAGNSRIFGWMVHFSEINWSISEFSRNFPRKFLHHLTPLQNIRNFWLNRKTPNVTSRDAKWKSSFLFSFCSAYQEWILKFLEMVCVALIAKWTKWSWEFLYGVC